MIKDVIDESALSDEEIKAIAKKKWQTAKVPKKPIKKKKPKETEDKKILVQPEEEQRPKEKSKEKDTKSKKRENVNPFTYIKLKDENLRKMLVSLLPPRRVLSNAVEEQQFYSMIGSIVKDYKEEDLTASDLDDVVSLAKNNILVNRLLQYSSANVDAVLDVAASVEKFNRQIRDIKKSLASRRADRIDPKNKTGYSIVDLVHKYESQKKEEFDAKVAEWEKKKNKKYG